MVHHRKKNVNNIVIGLLVPLLFFFSCAKTKDSIPEKTVNIDKALKERIVQYYELEKKGDWSHTYNFRITPFKEVVRFDYYKSRMQKDSKGWKLESYKFVDCKQQNNLAYVKIAFIEMIPPDYLKTNDILSNLLTRKIRKMKFTEDSIWEKINGVWYTRSCCSRLHLS